MFLTWIILHLQLRRSFKRRLACLSAIVLCIVYTNTYIYIYVASVSQTYLHRCTCSCVYSCLLKLPYFPLLMKAPLSQFTVKGLPAMCRHT